MNFLNFYNFINFLKKQGATHVLLVCNRDVTNGPHLYGEDYYIHDLMSKLEKSGFIVDLAFFQRDRLEIKNKALKIGGIEDFVCKNSAIILHNVSPFYALKAKMRKKAKLVMPVYFLWNKSSSLKDNLRTNFGVLFWQPVIDAYLVLSPNLAIALKKRGIIRPIIVQPPEYKCPYCDYTDNIRKRMKLERQLPKVVKAVYIGSLKPKRLPFKKIVKTLNMDRERMYIWTIFTASKVKEWSYRMGNVEINIYRRILSNEEKCRILRESHVFIAPMKGSTMEPSISMIEAEYHGAVVMRFE